MIAEMPWLYAFVLFASAIIGGSIFLATRRQSGPGLKLMLSFSAAYLLGLTLLHLFPDLFGSGIGNAGWYVLLGFMLQVVLDFFSHGVEHGHAHSHKHAGPRFFASIMVSLWIHAFIEGMPFGAEIQETAHAEIHSHQDKLLLGISLHKITESLVFTALLIHSGWSRKKALGWLVVFALIAPAGTFTNYFISQSGWSGAHHLAPAVIGILIGILLHVSTTILFESEEGHKFNWMKFLSILAGIGMAALIQH